MKALIPIVYLCFFACQKQKSESPAYIAGNWYPANHNAIKYTSIHFSNSTATFTSRGDTIYRFRYFVDVPSNTLLLIDPLNKKGISKILKSTDDSLVFNRLWELDTPQRFYRKNK